MKKQPHVIDTRFEQFVQELPADYQQQAYEFKAFARARPRKRSLQSFPEPILGVIRQCRALGVSHI